MKKIVNICIIWYNKSRIYEITKEKGGICMKKKIFKIILILLVIILVAFLTITIRKAYIINKFSKKLEEYQQVTNFYAKLETNDGTEELWRKDNVGITKSIRNDGTKILYRKDNEIWILIETIDSENNKNKKAYKVKYKGESDIAFLPLIEDGTFYAADIWQAIQMAFTSRLSIDKINGKKCYKFHMTDDFQVYINKEDFIKIKETNCNIERELILYEFNSLKSLKLPNLEEYEIEENL